jgi:hypothetical protein
MYFPRRWMNLSARIPKAAHADVGSRYLEFEIAGQPAIASVGDTEFDEISIKVMVRPAAQAASFIRAAILSAGREFAEAYTLA